MKLTIRSFCALVLVAAFSACAAPVVMVRWPATNPRNAVLASEGITIRSTDGSFVLRTGEPVMPPLVHDVSVQQSNQGGTWLSGTSKGGGYSPKSAVKADFWDSNGIQHAIMEVEIDVEGLDKPLVGRMIFFSVFDDSTESSARRMWRVQIPASHISGAKDGFVQTIYQPYKDESTDWCSWVLSFSSVVF